MKSTYTQHRGFTLVELLVVIAIIATLSGLSGAAFFGAKKASDKKQNSTFIKQLESSLESYKLDFGAYPESATDQTGSEKLYACLFGGADPDGTTTAREGVDTVYAPYLDVESPKSAAQDDGGTISILDPYGRPYLYLDRASNPTTNNPDFDLWSQGPKLDETFEDVNNW